jgi:uncharacterized protein YjiS (DUF1127 family)
MPKQIGAVQRRVFFRGGQGCLASVLAIGQMWHAYWHWRARQAILMLLHSLDERTLKDLGVTREEMNSFLDNRFIQARCKRGARRVAMTVTPKGRRSGRCRPRAIVAVYCTAERDGEKARRTLVDAVRPRADRA